MVPLRLGEINRIRTPLDLSEYEPHLRIRMNESCGGCPPSPRTGDGYIDRDSHRMARHTPTGLADPSPSPAGGLSIELWQALSIPLQPMTAGDRTRHPLPPAVTQASGVRTDSPMSRGMRSIDCGNFILFAREGRLPRDRQHDSHHGPPCASPHEAAATPTRPVTRTGMTA